MSCKLTFTRSILFSCCLLVTIIFSTPTVLARHFNAIAPYLVQLRHNSTPEENIACVGALVSPEHVITSANCFQRVEDRNNLIVVAGVSGNETGQQRSTIYNHTFHPEYVYNVSDNIDIAIIQLNKPMKMNDGVQAIDLCSRPLLTGEGLTISGWGLKKNDQDMTFTETTLPVTSTEKCLNTYNESYDTFVKDYLVCVTGPQLFIGCKGNKAGPAVQMGELCGFIAYGDEVCPGSRYIIPITSIVAIRDFIKNVIQK